MSQRTGILCKSCKVILNSEDDIFATSCGHLYHFSCIREFHGNSTQCRDCNLYKPMMFKMFLEFDKVYQPIPWEDQEKTIQILNRLEETKRSSTFLNRAFTISQESIQKLEAKIKTFKDALQAKENFVHELEDQIATLEELNKFLSINNNSNSNVQTKNWGAISKKKYNNNKNKQRNQEPKCYKKSQQQWNNGINNGNEKNDIANNAQFEEKPSEIKQTLVDSTSPNKIIIKNIKLEDLKGEPAAYIISLANQMNMHLNRSQIRELTVFIDGQNSTLVVDFIDKNIRDKFINKKNILQFFIKTQFLEIS